MPQKFAKLLEKLTAADEPVAGNKAVILGKLIKRGINVPGVLRYFLRLLIFLSKIPALERG